MIRLISFLFLLTSCATIPTNDPVTENQKYFGDKIGCFLLYDVKTDSFKKVINEENCRTRVTAASTFKVPLAVMGFDSGILKDENTLFKWSGMKDEREVANKDHTAKTWMRDSIVWYSQRITKKLGKKRFQQYLDAFDYGNRDFDDGLTTAWWKPAPDAKGAIQISAYEQVEFLKKLWKGTLLAKPRAMKLARETTYLETSPNGYKLHGKTGSNFFDKKRDRRQGWFIAHLERGGEEYIVVTNFSDSKPTDEKGYGGLRAKEITKQILAEEGLW